MSAPQKRVSIESPAWEAQLFETEVGTLAVDRRRTRSARTPPLVLWPALFSDVHLYDRLTPLLACDDELILFDPPGQGRSRLASEPMTLAATARACLDVLTRLGIRDMRWVGTSWGGMIGIHAALQAPERIAHLACLNTPFDRSASPDLRTRLIITAAGLLGSTTAFANGVARSYFRPETRTGEPAFVENQRGVFRKADRSMLKRVSRHVLIERENLTPLLPGIRVPTLILAARQDMYSVAAMQAAAELIPGALFTIVENSRHISVVDAPEAVNEALRKAWISVEVSTQKEIS
jgi:3-oxoadipate enol-lactonase